MISMQQSGLRYHQYQRCMRRTALTCDYMLSHNLLGTGRYGLTSLQSSAL